MSKKCVNSNNNGNINDNNNDNNNNNNYINYSNENHQSLLIFKAFKSDLSEHSCLILI